ncbi:hypothetical protein [Streptomyces lavendulae]|uniref:hypothetical protein n=1 Tax=Streptomyces lavendulae TaxID=1914 RepID=UPI0036E2AFCB
MNTATLDAAAQRYRSAEDALKRARAELTAEVVLYLRATDERGAQADVARRTGWSREQIRQIMQAAKAEQPTAE